jgi:hypothetical protein
MVVAASIATCALLGILLLWYAVARLRRRRPVAGTLGLLSSLVMLLLAAGLGMLAGSLGTYQRLAHEQPALEIRFTQTGERRFDATLTYPEGKDDQQLTLRGDEWQIDARVLKWYAFVNLFGFDAAYRLERISGRYSDMDNERTAARTVHALNPPRRIDAWELARRYREWMPWIDAYYGSATYLPMADGAAFEVKVSQSGLTARPLNLPAKRAVGNWR